MIGQWCRASTEKGADLDLQCLLLAVAKSVRVICLTLHLEGLLSLPAGEARGTNYRIEGFARSMQHVEIIHDVTSIV